MKSLLLTSALLLSTNTFADHHGSLGAHEHGHVKLSVAVEGKVMDIDMDAPAESFLGFEYLPKSAAEKKTFSDSEALWSKNLLSLFTLDKSLSCTVSGATFKQVVEEHEEKPAKGHKKEAGVHSDIEAQAKITCNADLKGKMVAISVKKSFPKIKELKLDLIGTETKSIDMKKPVENVKL